MVKIYTDASVAKGNAVSTCFVLTDTNFLGYNTFSYESVETSVEGELLGILNAAKYYQSLSVEDTDVVIFCDSINAINLIGSVELGDATKQTWRYQDLLESIIQLKQSIGFSLQLIEGHQMSHNPNKIVDLFSNSMLRIKNGKE